MTTIYVTKGCLTSGVVRKVDVINAESGIYLVKNSWPRSFLYPGEYCLDEVDALRKARSMRDKKIASLERQIAKLNSTTFGEAK